MSEIAAPSNADSAPPRTFLARLKDSDLLANLLLHRGLNSGSHLGYTHRLDYNSSAEIFGARDRHTSKASN